MGKKTIKLDPKDALIQIKVNTMKPGIMMYSDPTAMYILKNGECWLDPTYPVYPEPDLTLDRIMGLLKDFDGKFIVFARNLDYYWEKMTKSPFKSPYSIKEIRPIASEVTEAKKIMEESFMFSDDEDDEEWGVI